MLVCVLIQVHMYVRMYILTNSNAFQQGVRSYVPMYVPSVCYLCMYLRTYVCV